MICGIVDVGSNTIRLSLYRCEAEGNHLLMHRKVMAGLASYVEGAGCQRRASKWCATF